MASVLDLARAIVQREGGFADDPDDPGGATNHGVTLATLQRLHGDVTGDGATDVADIRALTAEQAAAIFVEVYFDRPGLGRLPEALQPGMFDMYVNAGAHAVTLLQRLLNQKGFSCAIDGRIGPETIRAARQADAAAPGHLGDAYGMARREYYYALADARPASRKYARRRDGGKGGWILRAEDFIAPEFRLTEAEHRARVAAWG